MSFNIDLVDYNTSFEMLQSEAKDPSILQFIIQSCNDNCSGDLDYKSV